MTKAILKKRSVTQTPFGRRATVSDVAQRAGVGTMTVSRAINHPEMVSAGLRDRILEAINELQYIPNRVAGGLASGSANAICVIVPTLNHPVYVPVLDGLYSALPAAGYQMLLGTSEYLPEGEESLVSTFLGWQPGGLILAGVDHTSRTKSMLEQARIPVVEIMDLTRRPLDLNIGFSHQSVGRAVGKFLLERAYKHVAYVGNRLKHDLRGMRRLNGFQAAFKNANRSAPFVLDRDLPSSIQAGGLLLRTLIEVFPKVEAAFFTNDDLAAGALFECQRCGIRVPEDFGIVGFNDQEIASQVNPGLTSVSTQRLEMGRQAAELLLARLNGQPIQSKRVDLGFQVMERHSTRSRKGAK